LSRGLLSGSKPRRQGDFRGRLPRFTGVNYEKNQKLLAAFEEFARAAGASPAQIAVAYVLAKEPLAVPVMGARTRQQLDEALRGTALRLSAEDVREIERRVPWEQVAGSRYDEHQMRMLDSER
jgi:aryl-alcohol dehydrogenase-like predicted oxidoreductase